MCQRPEKRGDKTRELQASSIVRRRVSDQVLQQEFEKIEKGGEEGEWHL